MKKYSLISVFILFIIIFIVSFIFLYSSNTKNKNVPTIYMYNGKGANIPSIQHTIKALKGVLTDEYEFKTINKKQIIKGNWMNDAVLLVFPGGSSDLYSSNLTGRANQKIKQYILDGGSFMGICAGAIHLSQEFEFLVNDKIHFAGKNELGIFKGKSIFPILAPYTKDKSGVRAIEAIINLEGKEYTTFLYSHGGGYLKDADKYDNVNIIGSYVIEGKYYPTMISMNYGKGKIFLSHGHPEMQWTLLDNDNTHIKKILPIFIKYDEYNKQIFTKIINVLISI